MSKHLRNPFFPSLFCLFNFPKTQLSTKLDKIYSSSMIQRENMTGINMLFELEGGCPTTNSPLLH